MKLQPWLPLGFWAPAIPLDSAPLPLLSPHWKCPYFLACKAVCFTHIDQLFKTDFLSPMHGFFFFDFFLITSSVARLLLINHFIVLVLLSQEELTALIIRAVHSWNLLNQASMLRVSVLLEKWGSWDESHLGSAFYFDLLTHSLIY